MQYYKITKLPLVKSYNSPIDTHDAPLVSYGGIDAVITSDIRNGDTYHRTYYIYNIGCNIIIWEWPPEII